MDDRERLERIEAACEAASPGPWEVGDLPGRPHGMGAPLTRADAEFIAMARTEVPWLLEIVASLSVGNVVKRERDAAREERDAARKMAVRVAKAVAGMQADEEAGTEHEGAWVERYVSEKNSDDADEAAGAVLAEPWAK